MKLTNRQQRIIALISVKRQLSISQILELLNEDISQVTLNRDLAKLVKNQFLTKTGKARAIRYAVSNFYQLFAPINLATYFSKEPDQRSSAQNFNHELYDLLADINNAFVGIA